MWSIARADRRSCSSGARHRRFRSSGGGRRGRDRHTGPGLECDGFRSRSAQAVAARGAPVWCQLFATDQWLITQALAHRADAAGCPALVLTVDLQGGSNREPLKRARGRDPRDCATCHEGDPLQVVMGLPRKPMFAGLDMSGVTRHTPLDMMWDYVDRLRGSGRVSSWSRAS